MNENLSPIGSGVTSLVLGLLAHINLDHVAGTMLKLCQENGSPGRIGGVLALALVDPKTSDSGICSLSFGEPKAKFGSFGHNAPEKIKRLDALRRSGQGDIASSQSADMVNPNERLRTYGGCVVFTKVIQDRLFEVFISISGGPPAIDEALAFAIGSRLGLTAFAYTNDYNERAFALTAGAVQNLHPSLG